MAATYVSCELSGLSDFSDLFGCCVLYGASVECSAWLLQVVEVDVKTMSTTPS